ncbi:MAG: hypothetical protein ACOYJA_04400 [Christensenellales bacterium]
MSKHDEVLNIKSWEQTEINELVHRAIRNVGKHTTLNPVSTKSTKTQNQTL